MVWKFSYSEKYVLRPDAGASCYFHRENKTNSNAMAFFVVVIVAIGAVVDVFVVVDSCTSRAHSSH